jgi:uncharacterized protein (TIGR00369 family)
MDGCAGGIGVGDVSATDGRARFAFQAQPGHLNPAGSVHGGVLATLVDTAMGAAVRSLTEDSEVPATSQLTVAYLSPAKPGELLVSAEVRKRGKSLLVCDAEVEQDGEAVVHAVATFALLQR